MKASKVVPNHTQGMPAPVSAARVANAIVDAAVVSTLYGAVGEEDIEAP